MNALLRQIANVAILRFDNFTTIGLKNAGDACSAGTECTDGACLGGYCCGAGMLNDLCYSTSTSVACVSVTLQHCILLVGNGQGRRSSFDVLRWSAVYLQAKGRIAANAAPTTSGLALSANTVLSIR